jgi:hypothetical protein
MEYDPKLAGDHHDFDSVDPGRADSSLQTGPY